MEIDRVIETIKKLSVRTIDRGCTEAEANQAMTRIDQLMRTYNLTLDKVFLDQNHCVTKTLLNTEKKHPIAYVSVAISKFCDCRMWRSGSHRGSDGHTYSFFGMESDVDMAIYLFNMLKSAIDSEAEKVKSTEEYKRAYNKRGFTASFYTGISNRLSDRLNEMRKARQTDEDTTFVSDAGTLDNNGQGTSLVVLKINKVQSEFEKLGLRLRNGSRSARSAGNGYSAGHEAGNRVNLNRPVGGTANLRLKHG